MRKLVVVEFLSLDGVMQAPGAADEDTSGGFEHGGWQQPYFDDVLGADAAEGMAATDTYLFGRRTYEIMARYWPNAPSDDMFAAHLNGTEKYVASRTLQEASWQNSSVIQGDVVSAVSELKRQPGKNITVLGSGELVRTLAENGVVDQYSLTVSPIVLGSGRRLFQRADRPVALRLVSHKATSTGSLVITYQPA